MALCLDISALVKPTPRRHRETYSIKLSDPLSSNQQRQSPTPLDDWEKATPDTIITYTETQTAPSSSVVSASTDPIDTAYTNGKPHPQLALYS